MKCSRCGWKGEESELTEEPTELDGNDYLYTAIYVMGIERRNFLCPICRMPLQTARVLFGSEQARERLQ